MTIYREKNVLNLFMITSLKGQPQGDMNVLRADFNSGIFIFYSL